MSDVERFDLAQPTSHSGCAEMEHEPVYGDWVRATDYDALVAKLAEVSLDCLAAHSQAEDNLARAEYAETALATARRDALEEAVEAAWLADSLELATHGVTLIAERIRALTTEGKDNE